MVNLDGPVNIPLTPQESIVVPEETLTETEEDKE